MAFDTSTVLTIMRTDTTQAELAVKRLRGVERERAKELLNNIDAENRNLSSQIANWTKVGAAVGAVVGAYKVAQVAARAYMEDVRLEAAAAGANVDKLRESVQGLVDTDTLLKFAGQAQHGVWKLNQQEMELVLQTANAMRFTMGAELVPTVQKLGDALAKGTTRSLKEFGIEAKDKTAALDQMRKIVGSLRGETTMVGDEFERSGVKWTDAVDDLKGAFGKLVIQLGPVVTEFAKIVELSGRMVKAFSALPEFTKGVFGEDFDKTFETMLGAGKLWIEVLDRMSAPKVNLFPPPVQQPMGPPVPGNLPNQWTLPWSLTPEERARMIQAPRGFDPWRKIESNLKAEDLEVKRVKGDRLEFINPGWDVIGKSIGDGFVARLGAGDLPWQQPSIGAGRGLGGGAIDMAAASPLVADLKQAQAMKEFEEHGARILQQAQQFTALQQQTRQRTLLEALFGTPAEIDLMMMSMQMAGQSFQVLTQAGGAAMDAWITGQKSIGEAFKDAVAEGLRALAVQATVEALKHTAFGVGALAFGPLGGFSASQHFAAAGLFAGVAVAAGAGARAMGAGGSPSVAAAAPPSAAGSALAPRSSGGPVEQGNRQTVIMLGSDILNLPELERRQLIYQAVQQGNVMDIRTTTISRG